MGLYKSLARGSKFGFGILEAPFLCGYTLGNSNMPGCLSHEENAKIHSCEPGMQCSKITKGRSIYITPVVTRAGDGSEVPEVGAGGGKGDLYQNHELELTDEHTLQQLTTLCSEQIKNTDVRDAVLKGLAEAYNSKSKSLSLNEYGVREYDEISIKRLIGLLGHGMPKEDEYRDTTLTHSLPHHGEENPERSKRSGAVVSKYPSDILYTDNNTKGKQTFPYSRHSSYAELCTLVGAFKPKDIYPCTVDTERWSEKVSMRSLFGHLCSDTKFSHDEAMRELLESDDYRPRKRARRMSNASSEEPSTQRSCLDELLINEDNIETQSRDPVEMKSYVTETSLPDVIESSRDEQDRSDKTTCTAPSFHDNNVVPEPTNQLGSGASLRNSSHNNRSLRTPNPRISAVKAALKQKRENQELDFHYPSSSFEMDTQTTSQFSTQASSTNENGREFNESQENDNKNNESHHYNLHPGYGPRPSTPSPMFYGVQNTTNTESQELDTETESLLTLSPSAFDSQHSVASLSKYVHSNPATGKGNGHDDGTRDHGPIPSDQHRNSRMAAYRAARSGSFENWSGIHTPMSAGNNHYYEEDELA